MRDRAELFWQKVEKTAGCWTWTGALGRRGYGLFWDGVRLVPAHRFAWQMAGGMIPAGVFVCHRCDNPPCVRVSHLFLGTHLLNMADRETKNRTARGDRHVSRTHPEVLMRGDTHYARTEPERLPRGEGHGMTTLSDEEVRAIRRRATGRNGSALAREYGVNKTTVSNIIRRRTWGHLS